MKIGAAIWNAVKKAYPLSSQGVSRMPNNLKFDLKNPYILEAISEQKLRNFSKFDGKDLQEVCKLLDKSSSGKGFTDFEIQALYKKAFPNIKIPTGANEDAIIYLSRLSPEVGSKFDAHGLAKLSITDQLKQLNNLLANGIDNTRAFHTAPLAAPKGIGVGIGTGGHAYYDGSFILVGEKGKLITEDGIKHVIVNDAYYNIIKDLQLKFSDVNFVRADQAVEYFSKL